MQNWISLFQNGLKINQLLNPKSNQKGFSSEDSDSLHFHRNIHFFKGMIINDDFINTEYYTQMQKNTFFSIYSIILIHSLCKQ